MRDNMVCFPKSGHIYVLHNYHEIQISIDTMSWYVNTLHLLYTYRWYPKQGKCLLVFQI